MKTPHENFKDYPRLPGNRTVICVPGLGGSALWCEKKHCCHTQKRVRYCSARLLAIDAEQTIEALEMHFEKRKHKDGSVERKFESRAGCKIFPVEGQAGICTLNPGDPAAVERIGIWDALISELHTCFNFHAFAYDWRRWGELQYVDDLVGKFKDQVEEAIAKDQHPSKKAALIGHSTGASLILYALSQLGVEWQQRNLDQVILVAPLHMGAPAMLASFAQAHPVPTVDWLPAQEFVDTPLGRICGTWPCVVASLPMSVGKIKPWPDKHVFCQSVYKKYKLADMGQFLDDLARCRESRELGSELWPDIKKIREATHCPAVPTDIIYGDKTDTPNEFTYRSADLSQAPHVKSHAPGDGVVVGQTLEKVIDDWSWEGYTVDRFACPEEVLHKDMMSHPFTTAFIERLLVHEELNVVTVKVFKAEDLPDFDGVGLSDPYIWVGIPGTQYSHRSQVMDDTLNPVWNFECIFYNFKLGIDSLAFVVYDYDPLDPDDVMGKAVLRSEGVKGCYEGDLDLSPGPGNITVKASVEYFQRRSDKPWFPFL